MKIVGFDREVGYATTDATLGGTWRLQGNGWSARIDAETWADSRLPPLTLKLMFPEGKLLEGEKRFGGGRLRLRHAPDHEGRRDRPRVRRRAAVK